MKKRKVKKNEVQNADDFEDIVDFEEADEE